MSHMRMPLVLVFLIKYKCTLASQHDGIDKF